MRDAPSTASRLPLPLARLVQFLYASLCVTFSCCRYFYDFYSPDIFTVPPLSVHHPPLPLCLYCTLLVVLSHSFYVLFSATLLLCHFTFVTLPSSFSLHPSLSSCLPPYPFSTLCVASLWRCPRSYFMCFHLPRTTDAHWLHTQDCPSPFPTALSSLPPPSLLLVYTSFNYLSLGQPLSILKRSQFCFPFDTPRGPIFLLAAPLISAAAKGAPVCLLSPPVIKVINVRRMFLMTSPERLSVIYSAN